MPRDILHEKELRAATVGPSVADGKPGMWQAMTPWQKGLAIGMPVAVALGGAAYFYGPPPAHWPAAVTALSPGAPEPKVEAPQQPTVAAPPGAVAQRRTNARPTLEQIAPAQVLLPGFAQQQQPSGGQAQPPTAGVAPAPRPAAPRLDDQLPQPQDLAETERVAGTAYRNRTQDPEPQEWEETVRIAETAVPKADPMAAVERLVQANKRAQAAPAPPPPAARSATEAEMAAMITRLTAMVGDLAKMQMQDRDDFKLRLETLARENEDLKARQSLNEARSGFFALASGGAARPAEREAPPPAPSPTRRSTAPEVPPGSPVLGPQSYVVTSASPFLATVQHRNPMPNQPPPPELRVGETVPGLGKVLGISQEGTTWVVRTECGPITSGPISPQAR